jgi:hypothetical protein
VSREELDMTAVVFDDATGRKSTRAGAAAAVFAALPLPFHLLRAVALPGVRGLSNRVYDLVARHRHAISRRLGYAACGLAPVAREGGGEAQGGSIGEQGDTGRPLRWVVNGVAAVLLVVLVIDAYNENMSGRMGGRRIPQPDWMRALIQVPQLRQDWRLFAPDPLRDDGWWVLYGLTEYDAHVDLLTGKPPVWDKPEVAEQQYNVFWHKILFRLSNPVYQDFRKHFARYIARRDQREHPPGQRLIQFDFYYLYEPTLPQGSPEPFPVQRLNVWTYDCIRDRITPERVLQR